MSRRSSQPFSLSFLDLLTSALGAVIFLFIITPKGGAPAAKVQQVGVYVDTVNHRILGQLHDSLLTKRVGDTLFAVLVDYKDIPDNKKEPVKVLKEPEIVPVEKPKPTPRPKVNIPVAEKEKPKKTGEIQRDEPTPKKEEPKSDPVKEEKPPVYRGDAPSVPCLVSFEISWGSAQDNVDLIVCRGNSCVYGGRKKDNLIGQWDSGKSRNRLFGNDLRTNQEAVRQFDQIIPGEFKVYAQFKESSRAKTSVTINGLIYTKGANGQERGESFRRTLKITEEPVLLGKIVLNKNGTYNFIKV